MAEVFNNFARSELDGAIGASDTSLKVQPGDGALFPAPTGGDFFNIVVFKKSTGENEIMRCTARATDTLTVTRAQEGTTAIAFANEDVVANRPTAAFFNGLATTANIQANQTRYAAAGGTANAQTVTLSPAPTALVDGQELFMLPVDNNTGAATINTNALGAVTVKKLVNGVVSDLEADDLDTQNIAHLVYNSAGPRWELKNPRLGTAALLNTGVGDDDVVTGTILKDTVRAFTAQQTPASAALSISVGAVTWDLDTAPVATLTLDQDVTSLTINNKKDGGSYLLRVIQDNVGGWEITWPTEVKWPLGVAPVLTVDADAKDLISFESNGTNMDGVHVPDFK